MEDNPSTNVEEQGIDEREALVSFDAVTVDKENIQVGNVDHDNTSNSSLGFPLKRTRRRRPARRQCKLV